MKEIKLGTYRIFIGSIEASLTSLINKITPSKVFIISDENVDRDCLPLLVNCPWFEEAEKIVVRAGEQYKTIETCQDIWKEMMVSGLDRKSLVLNIGGGVIGDMGGFCASTYKRGLRFIQVPTTVLSAVDASVGGKLGVDFFGLKNNIGLFADPQGVCIDPRFFETLTPREVRSGYAEVLKHCLINDKTQWDELSRVKDLSTIDWSTLVAQNVLVKKNIVAKDPYEQGVRKALNFGHTIGHAIETNALRVDISLLHGEAVAIGMIVEAYLSYKLLGMSLPELEEIKSYILEIYGRVDLSPFSMEDLFMDMYQDKKNENGLINCTLLNAIGDFEINQWPSVKDLEEGLVFYVEELS